MVECVCNVGDNVYSPILNLPPPPPWRTLLRCAREWAGIGRRLISVRNSLYIARDATLVGDSNDA